MNLDGKYKRLKFGLNFSPSYSTSNRVDASGSNGIVQSALMMPPVWPVYNSDGSYNYQGNGYWRIGNDYQHNAVLNPVAMANLQSDVVDRMAIVGKVFAELELYKGLTYNISFGGDYYGSHNDQYRSSELPLLGQKYYDVKSNPTAYSSSGFYFNWLVENKINYNTTIKDAHSINVVLVQSAQKETYKGDNVTATDFPNDYIQTISGGTVTKGASDKTQWTIASYLARMQYSYKGKYMASAAIRADGSSRFGKNNRWGYFPSAAAPHFEKFFQTFLFLPPIIWAVGILCKLSGRYPYYIVRITDLQVFFYLFYKFPGNFFAVMSINASTGSPQELFSPPPSASGRPREPAPGPAAAAPWTAASGTSPAFPGPPASA